MTKKLNFDAIHGHVEHEPAKIYSRHPRLASEILAGSEKPEAPPTTKPLDFSAIHGWKQISPTPTVEETASEPQEPSDE